MDIKKLQQEQAREDEGVVIPIFDKVGQPYTYQTTANGDVPAQERGSGVEQCTITVVGSDSKRVREAERATTRRNLKQARGAGTTLTPEQLEANRISVAAAGVVDWTGWEENGRPWPCTPENVRSLLSLPHILRQVEEGINHHAAFFAQSSGS